MSEFRNWLFETVIGPLTKSGSKNAMPAANEPLAISDAPRVRFSKTLLSIVRLPVLLATRTPMSTPLKTLLCDQTLNAAEVQLQGALTTAGIGRAKVSDARKVVPGDADGIGRTGAAGVSAGIWITAPCSD